MPQAISISLSMNERIVINAGPLIALGKMRAFEIIVRLPFEFLCPREVQMEIQAGVERGYPVSMPEWIAIADLTSIPSAPLFSNLDSGEAAVIQIALENNISTVCLDESKGRRIAAEFGLRVVGSLGLLGKAKTLGLINAVRPYVGKAQSKGIFYDPKLVEHFLTSMSE